MRDELMAIADRIESIETDWLILGEMRRRNAIASDLRALAQRLGGAPVGMSVLVDALEGAMIESLHGEGFDLWDKNRGSLRNRLPENVGAIIVKMRALLAATPPAPSPAGAAPNANCVIVAIERGEGYEDVHPELVAEDAFGKTPFKYHVIDAAPSPVDAASAQEWLRPAAFNESAHVTVMTYTSQPGNVEAWRLGEARAKSKQGGDYIDGGLSLLRELHARGYGIVRVSPLQPPTTQEPTHADR